MLGICITVALVNFFGNGVGKKKQFSVFLQNWADFLSIAKTCCFFNTLKVNLTTEVFFSDFLFILYRMTQVEPDPRAVIDYSDVDFSHEAESNFF